MNILLLAAIFLFSAPALANKVASAGDAGAAVICEGKKNNESYIKLLSDYELTRVWFELLMDERLQGLHEANDIGVWLGDQPDCEEWEKNTYMLEVKWMYAESVSRGLKRTINKIIQGEMRLNKGQIQVLLGKNWRAWEPYIK